VRPEVIQNDDDGLTRIILPYLLQKFAHIFLFRMLFEINYTASVYCIKAESIGFKPCRVLFYNRLAERPEPLAVCVELRKVLIQKSSDIDGIYEKLILKIPNSMTKKRVRKALGL